jgi:predicted RNA methylase
MGNYVLSIPDLQHHLFTMTFDGKLHIAPIEEIKGGIHNVLDIGTGTGIWAIDFGINSFISKLRNFANCQMRQP